MSEVHLPSRPWPPEPVPGPALDEAVSRALTARAGLWAMRIADLLAARFAGESRVDEAAAFLRTWADDLQPPAGLHGEPLARLTARYGLSQDEQDLIVLAGLPEEHEGLASTLRTMHPQGEPRVTSGLAALLLGEVTSDRSRIRRLLSEGVAVRAGLIQLTGPGALFERSLACADQLWDALHGHDAWPTAIERADIGEVPPGLEGWLDLVPVRNAVAVLREDVPSTILVNGPDDTVGLARCAALAQAVGLPLVAGRLAASDRSGVVLLAAHAAARGAVPALVITQPADREATAAQALALREVPGPVFVVSSWPLRTSSDRPLLAIPTGPVGTSGCRTAWRKALPHLAEHAPALAARHPLDPAYTVAVAIDARALPSCTAGAISLPEVSGLIRARAALDLPAGIRLMTPNVAWDRLVLPEEPTVQLRDAVARLAYQSQVLDDWGMREQARGSRGARLMFSGPPGTGKSLAAEVVATAAATDLLTVDLSRMVSKWIGETEKNLAAAFDAAERTQAVLFMDEADALFGSRTEINDAHDRYANMETAYLLQRLDHFDGLVVLATNLSHNVDPAFARRMDFVIEFPLPDVQGRQDLWSLHLPADVIADDVDTDTLSRLYPIPGGWIRNAAIAAAFRAAEAHSRIRQRHLVTAIRREYAKSALPFPGEPLRRSP
jgi:ATPase family associated with various cellular activities (AAA)